MNPLSELLAGRDRWTGAACLGRWQLFDPRRDDEAAEDYSVRVTLAQGICGTCPILTTCRDYAGNARPNQRAGIWAGIAYDHRGRPDRAHQKGTAE